MKKNLLFFLLVGLLAFSNAWAQTRKITGNVVSSDDGQSLPGVSIKVLNSNVGTQTSTDGGFSLNVGSNSTIQFSYIGYVTQTVRIGNANTYNIKMVPDNKALSEIVVTGYGVQQKREITGSIVSIKASQIEDRPIQTIDKALQGRAAGVQVTSSSGQPGGGIDVRIRGIATINGTTQPLYIIDGVQVNTGGLSSTTSVNALSSINPNDIESIEILKDAASSAVYGSLAANGVVIVTTKRGRVGKTQISASAQFGASQQYNPYKVLGAAEYLNLQREAYVNYYNRTLTTTFAGNDPIAAANAASYPGGVPSSITNNDWIKAISQTGHVSQYDLSLNGGDAKTKFFISGSYNSTDGTIKNSLFKRGTIRSNIDHKVSDKFSISTSLNLTGSQQTGPSTSVGFFTNTPFTGALLTAPVNAIYNPDGTYNTTLSGINTTNTLQYINLEQRNTGIFQTVDNITMTYNILPELSLRAFGGLDFSDTRDFNYRPSTIPSSAAVLGTGTETFRRNINYNTGATLNFNKKFGNHNLTALAGVEYRSARFNVLSASAQGFPSPLLNLLSQASTPTTTSSTYTGYRIAGILGQLKYDYKGKYLLTANARDDGSSRFGSNKKYGLFYGFSAGWNVTAEDFMKDVSFISQLKPKASYGVTGSQPGNDYNFISQNLYGGGGQYISSTGTTLLGGLRPAQLPNADFSWERSAMIDLGVDLGFFNNRIALSVDVYRKKNTDLILPVTYPGDSGFTSYNQNAGSAKSEGLEIDLNTINFDSKNGFRWSTNFNIAFNRNKLLSLVNGQTQTGTYTYTVGRGFPAIYTYQWAGVNPADGRQMFYDANGNITYSPKTADQRIVGNQVPKFYGGFDNTFSYKGLSLDLLFQYQYGNYSYLQSAQYIEQSGSIASNQLESQLQRWTAPGQITSVPQAYYTATAPGGLSYQTLSSRFVERSSYIRLKQVTLNYTLPRTLFGNVKMPAISVFFQGLNLATITNYRGDDPENTGNNLNFYPNPRTYTGGINVKF
ncbi:SusC/RagA family TonB-linked outer membrane protein [Mucilaginibacter koreensis]